MYSYGHGKVIVTNGGQETFVESVWCICTNFWSSFLRCSKMYHAYGQNVSPCLYDAVRFTKIAEKRTADDVLVSFSSSLTACQREINLVSVQDYYYKSQKYFPRSFQFFLCSKHGDVVFTERNETRFFITECSCTILLKLYIYKCNANCIC